MVNLIMAGAKLFAHEVYVLTPGEIAKDERSHINPWSALSNNHDLLLAIAFTIGITLVLLAAAYLKRTQFFQKLGATINKATVIAPDIIRIAFGASLLFSAQHNALFGPELPLHDFAAPGILRIALAVCGAGLVAGIRVRFFGIIALLIWLLSFFTKGWYMLTYTNYLAEAIAVILLPVQALTIDRLIYKIRGKPVPTPTFEKYSLPVTRIGFAFALFYTAIAIKFAQASLPLDVVHQYQLTRFFPFDPLFIVLGAGLVEILIAVLYSVGLLQRLTTVVFLVFITLSIVFFKEEVWPHYLLLALGVGIFLHEPDDYALDKYWFNRKPKKSPAKRSKHSRQTSNR